MNCKKIEETVTNESEDAEGGTIFNKLEELKLTGLPSLKRFCPGVFKTPTIRLVTLEEDEIWWEEDLNKRAELIFSARDDKHAQES